MAKAMTQNEYNALNAAVAELLQSGTITSKCPRCGKPLIYEEKGSMEIVRCEDLTCVKSIRRGI